MSTLLLSPPNEDPFEYSMLDIATDAILDMHEEEPVTKFSAMRLGGRVFASMRDMLIFIRDKGIRLHLISGAPSDTTYTMLWEEDLLPLINGGRVTGVPEAYRDLVVQSLIQDVGIDPTRVLIIPGEEAVELIS